MFKKIISFLICLTMVLSFVPAMAEDVAETTTTEATYVNVALNKPVTAGRYLDSTTKDDINDGDVATGVYSVEDAQAKFTDDPNGMTQKTNDWYQIDLGDAYQIDHVILKKDKSNWYTTHNFKISVSNSSDFSDGTAIDLGNYPEQNAPFVAIEETEDATDAALVLKGNGNSYRFIRLQRLGYSSYERYTELEVWVDESTIVKPINVALNKPIKAGIYDDYYQKKNRLNDGDDTTGLAYDASQPVQLKTDNPEGVGVSNQTNAWWEIDLGAKYQIEEIVLKWENVGTFWATGFEFEIQASNTPGFSADTYVTLGAAGGATPVSAPFVVKGDGNYYRYVRLQKVPGMNQGYNKFNELEVYALEETAIKPANVAVNKPITAGCYDPTWIKPTSLNDGNIETFVYHGGSSTHNVDGVPSPANQAWYQIDLGARYKIENVAMVFGSGYTGTDFKISVSNSPDFSDGTAVVLASEANAGASPYYAAGNGNSYRYVRWERVPGPTSNLGGYGHTNFQELEVYAYEETAIYASNIAVNKPITAGTYDAYGPKTNLNDGNPATAVWYDSHPQTKTDNADGIPSGKNNAWYQIDLGARYQIENVTMIFGGYTGCDFKISVSNSPDFSDGTAKVIATETDKRSPYVANGDGGYYRYVRWDRVPGNISNQYGHSDFYELEVYAYEDSVIKPVNIAVNKAITAGIYQNAGAANPKANLNDGNMDTVVFCGGTESDNVGGVPSARTDAWFQIDLGARYLIEKIQLWYNASSADYVIPYNFNILVSNSPDFSDGKAVKVIEVGDNGVTPAEVTDGDVTRKLISVASDGNYYRYVRWERTEGSYSIHGYSDLAELEVYAYPENVQQEQITIGTPQYYAPIKTVSIPYTFENLADDTVITLWAVAKNSDGKVISVNAQNFTDDASSQVGLLLDTVEGASYIQVFAWKGLEPLATLDAIQIN